MSEFPRSESDRRTTAGSAGSGGAHPIRARVESQWPKSLLALVVVVAVLGMVKFGTDPRDSSADGLDLVVGSTSSVAGDDLQVVAEFDFPSYRVQILDGPELPCLIAVHDSDGRALGVYERYDLAVRSFPEIESTALAGSFAMMSPPPADR